MPFIKADIKKEVYDLIANDKEFERGYNNARKEYDLIKMAVEYRKQIGLTQDKVAEQSGL